MAPGSEGTHPLRAVAVVGMCGAGKSEVAGFLRERGFQYLRFGQVTIDELERRKLPVTEANERRIREEIRSEGGMGAFAERLLPQIKQALKSSSLVIDGLYSWTEYKVLRRELGSSLTVVAVAASRQTRYERLAVRPVRPLSPQEAEQRDVSEIEQIEKGGPIAMADHTLINDGSIPELRRQLARALGFPAED